MLKHVFKSFLYLGIGLISICATAQNDDEREDDLGDVSDAFQEAFFEGLKQAAIENHEKAILAFTDCIEEDPENATVQYEIGKSYLETADYDLAEGAFKKAVSLSSDNEWFLDGLYQAYDKTNQDEKAIEILKQLTKYHPDYKVDLVKYYFNRRNYKEALMLLDTLDEEIGRDKNRDHLRKMIYNVPGNTKNKEAFFRRRIQSNPTEEDYYLRLIFLYSKEKNTEEAFKVAEHLLQNNPHSEKVHLGLYKFYLDSQDEEKAIASMTKVLKSSRIEEPSKRKVLTDFLSFAKGKTAYQETISDITESIEKAANNERMLTVLSNYYKSINQTEKSLALIKNTPEPDMNNFQSIKNYVLAMMEVKNYDMVLSKTAEAIELYPAQPILYLLNGVALNKKNMPDKAITSLEMGLDYTIDNPIMESDIYYQMAQAYKLKNNESKHTLYLLKAKETLENAKD